MTPIQAMQLLMELKESSLSTTTQIFCLCFLLQLQSQISRLKEQQLYKLSCSDTRIKLFFDSQYPNN